MANIRQPWQAVKDPNLGSSWRALVLQYWVACSSHNVSEWGTAHPQTHGFIQPQQRQEETMNEWIHEYIFSPGKIPKSKTIILYCRQLTTGMGSHLHPKQTRWSQSHGFYRLIPTLLDKETLGVYLLPYQIFTKEIY